MKTMINIKADSEIKENAQKLALELGLPLSGVINAFLRDFVRSRSISFSVTPKMSGALEIILGKIERDIQTGKNMSPSFSSAEAANSYLDSI